MAEHRRPRFGSSFPAEHAEPEGPRAKPARSPSVRPPRLLADSAADLESAKMVALAPLARVTRALPPEQDEPPPRALATRPSVKRLRRELLDPQLVLLLEPYSPRAASFRILRDNLLSMNAPRIVAISSASEREGKTTCAINLALALSERPSTRVLLLEGNFHAPSLAKTFHIDESTPVAADMDLPWLLPYRVAEVAHGFHVAAIWHREGEAPPAFNSRWYEMAMGHLSEADYDHLIIDAPALDGSATVLQVLGLAQGTLLTVRSGSTTARSLRRAAAHITRGRALGVALMDED